ncbi:calcium-binding protein [Synechococcus sp. BS55D]|uniref:calcium-binding protein n=1 Tax=Synechococcus sp. BS55D TaxID=2055943 RepID=UPI00103C6C93|nr:calcium-binding protein [Synechococcus sp. BS55D]TCD58050.1 hypothetical protein CWE16_01745 [Synechococcus sp. BS55D]
MAEQVESQSNTLEVVVVQTSSRSAGRSESYQINHIATASSSGDSLEAKQLNFDPSQPPAEQILVIVGSWLQGSEGSDILRGFAGWDILDGGAGNDLIHGGNGRDILSGGMGADELHGDFGRNTYTDQADGFVDLIAIKSDQFLVNWWYGQAGNSPNGEKADIIEKLDANDQIKIIGVATDRLSFSSASAHGQDGIGIFADGVLEALYTGGDLSAAQLSSMTSGDASDDAMNNQIWSYRFGHTFKPLP